MNNAGLQEPYELVDMPLESWRKVLDVNLTGAFLCCREAARLMERGTIVVNTSVHEVMPWMRYSHYAASKGGLKLFVQSIAKELAPRGIRVCSVAPGATKTPINEGVDEDASRDEIPAGRWAEAVEIARAIAWLASDQADYVVGTTLFVDGGMTLYPGWTRIGASGGDRRPFGPRPLGLDLRRQRDDRVLVVRPPDQLDGDRQAVAVSSAGTDAAGLPSTFHVPANG